MQLRTLALDHLMDCRAVQMDDETIEARLPHAFAAIAEDGHVTPQEAAYFAALLEESKHLTEELGRRLCAAAGEIETERKPRTPRRMKAAS